MACPLKKEEKKKGCAGGELALEMDRIHFCFLEIQGSNRLGTVTERAESNAVSHVHVSFFVYHSSTGSR